MIEHSIARFPKLSLPGALSLGLLGLLVFVYSVPGTVALRNLLLIAGFCSSFSGLKSLPPRLPLRPALAFWLMLTGWLVVQALTCSDYSGEALANIGGDWTRGALAGIFAASVYGRLKWENTIANATSLIFSVVVVGLAAHPAVYLLQQTFVWYQTGHFPLQYHYSWIGGRDFVSEVTNACVALLCGDLLGRALLQKPLLMFPSAVRFGLLAMCLLATFTLSTSLGTISLMVVLCLSLMLLAIKKGRRAIPAATATLVAIAVVISALAYDKRLSQVLDTLPLTRDVDQTKEYWMYQPPGKALLTASGMPAEQSTFLRVSYARVALREIVEHPLGLGYSHRAFGYAVNKRYGVDVDFQSSHSGWLDLALSGGIPAIIIWCVLQLSLMRWGLIAAIRQENPAGFLLLLYVVNYFVRSAIDNHMSGLRLEEFFLLVTLFAVASLPERQTACD